MLTTPLWKKKKSQKKSQQFNFFPPNVKNSASQLQEAKNRNKKILCRPPKKTKRKKQNLEKKKLHQNDTQTKSFTQNQASKLMRDICRLFVTLHSCGFATTRVVFHNIFLFFLCVRVLLKHTTSLIFIKNHQKIKRLKNVVDCTALFVLCFVQKKCFGRVILRKFDFF